MIDRTFIMSPAKTGDQSEWETCMTCVWGAPNTTPQIQMCGDAPNPVQRPTKEPIANPSTVPNPLDRLTDDVATAILFPNTVAIHGVPIQSQRKRARGWAVEENFAFGSQIRPRRRVMEEHQGYRNEA